MTVRLSTDDGKTWSVARRLHERHAAYLSLARLPDGTILCLYEGGDQRRSEWLRLARFNLEWLIDVKTDKPRSVSELHRSHNEIPDT